MGAERQHSTVAVWALAAALAVNALALAAAAADPPAAAGAARFARDVAVLASDEMEGRGLGTAGLGRAADWIEKRVREIGLPPAFPDGYRQGFEVKTGVALEAGNVLEGVASEAWTPLGMSSSGAFAGELAFVGYGIEAPPIGYRELEGIDLRGKVALVLRYEPQERDEGSPFDGRRPSRWSSMRYKVHQARERGAAAVVFVTGPRQDEEDRLPALRNDGPESPAGIPVLQVRRGVAEGWLQAAGIDLRRFQDDVDRDLRPRSRVVPGVRVSGRVALRPTFARAQNVAGIVPGRGTLAREAVVVGAHYDHLGYGGSGSMRPNERAIHNGADDNASGTVAVLLAAERVRAALADVPSHRAVVFALFAGEEVGLAGSSRFVAALPAAAAHPVAMINLDMVGRLRDDQLIVLGTESAPQWNALLDATAPAQRLRVIGRGDGYGPSDQTSFYAAGIPVLHLFTGTHEQYHRPEDKAGTLNPEGAARIAELTAVLASRVAQGDPTPVYARASAPPAREGDSRGYGAYLGTVPDYRAMEQETGGVLLADTRAGGPADRAGVRKGDRIVEMAGTRIENLHDMTFALQDHRPGETIDVVVVRGGERVTLRATLGERAARTDPAPAATPTASPAAVPVADPHSAPAAPATPASPSFYAGRPGRDFVIGAGKPFAARADEPHLAEVRQLTFAGENAEAYFSPDGRRLVFQATTEKGGCDQEYVLDLATGDVRRISSGKGRTTCGYYDWPEGDRIVYASTEAAGDACPPPPDRSQGYVWSVYDTYDLWEVPAEGGTPRRLTDVRGYDAEATWCHRGGKLVFTSSRDGDLDLYERDEAGQVRRLTNTPGYDGGAFYNADCTKIVWRANHPQGAALEEYRRLLAQGLVRPTEMELFVMKADGSEARQVTHDGAANFCPYFHPDSKRILYSSNAGGRPREFDLWLIGEDGTGAERITSAPGFDGFAVLSPDGTLVVWASNRADPESHQTNLFIARWIE
ncbi:MAG TPA: M28 family peptidase [Vicinamibacteria bacterium]|nr:M28 family peptidase [Vicinamibacteria bacterium]